MRAFIGHHRNECGLARRNGPGVARRYHSPRTPRTLKLTFAEKDHALGSVLERHRMLCPCTNVGCKMAAEVAGIIARAVDQGRLAPSHERSAHQVASRR